MRAIFLDARLPKASELGFGCASLGSRYDRSASLRALAVAFDHGVNVFDTAPSYGQGDSESILGEFARARRDRVVLATKAGILPPSAAPKTRRLRAVARRVFAFAPALRARVPRPRSVQVSHGHFEPPQIRASVEASLRALRSSHVDFLFLHDVPAEQALREDVLALLDTLCDQGKVLRAGASSEPAALVRIAASERARARPLQFRASVAAWPQWPAEFTTLVRAGDPGRARFGNQPFNGGALSPQLDAELAALGPRQEALLRLPLVAGVCDVLVTSMLTPQHIISNCVAVSAPTIPTDALAAVASSRLRSVPTAA
jgi:aryl-alcohol dehydrogenase-like predicted oxidoreductase